MPEGDTVWLTAHRLDQALAGREVATSDLRVPKLALVDLTGQVVTTVLARGKHILMRFDDGRSLHSHLRMDGSWQIGRAARRRSVGFDVRAIVGNSEWSCTGHRVHDLAIAPTEQESIWVGHLGPDVLGPDWDPDRAAALLGQAADRPIIEALLDQRNLAGVGNMYAAEMLYMARVNPFTKARDVPTMGALPRIAFKLLRANRDHPEQSSTGSMAKGEQHWVYLRTGQPCRRCRTPIVTAEFGEAPRLRNTFWCPRCQPG
jgi:endonuclease-8